MTEKPAEHRDSVPSPSRTSHAKRLILATLLVLAGLGAATVTVLARQANETGLAEAAAVLSLLIALLLTIFIVVAFAAWNTGNNLLFLVFSLLCSTLFVGWVAARSSLRDLTVSARFPDHIFAAEEAPVIVTLRNNKRVLPSFSVLVEARGPSDAEVKSKRRRRHVKRL